MSTGVLGLGSEGSLGLNQTTIDGLYDADYEARIKPIEDNILAIEAEQEALDLISTELAELEASIAAFDLYTSGTNAFDEVSATTTGDSASFDASDTSGLSPGSITVDVQQVAQKDVFQSEKITDKTALVDPGASDTDKITITMGGDTYEITTKDKTYEQIVEEMNNFSKIEASLEEVGDGEYRIIAKSKETGLDNSFSITQTGTASLGFEDPTNHTLTAQNMQATVDGVDYDISSNTINMQNGLNITSVKTGSSTISIAKDTTAAIDIMQEFVTNYNDLVTLVNDAIYSIDGEPPIVNDSSSLNTMMSDIKSIMLDSYGLSDEENMVKFGISFDQNGYMVFDSAAFAEEVAKNPEDAKEAFVGYAEKPGMGTRMKEYLFNSDLTDGIIRGYDEGLDKQLATSKEEKEKEIKKLDQKYADLQAQYAAQTVLITQMENEFAGIAAMLNSEE